MDSLQKDIALIHKIEAVPAILDVVCRTTGMGFAAVARVTDDHWIACTVKDDINFGLKPGGELELKTTICDEIRRARQPVIIDHVAEDPDFRDHHTPRMYGFQSYISMPIMLPGDRFFGTLCAIDPKPARLKTPEVIGMFKLFSELIAFHIEALEKTAAAEAQLIEEREAAELREQFIAVLGHDLRSPLGALSTGTMMLQKLAKDPQSATIAEMMQGSVATMTELIENVMDLARGRLGGGIEINRTASQPLQPLLDQVIGEMRSVWKDHRIETDFNLTENVDCDTRRIAQLFTNLLGNALKHGNAEQPIRATATASGGRFELSVSNGAEPIPATLIDRLFQPFFRAGAKKNHQGGLGLGLYIASEIAKAHGGTLQATSGPQETRFTFVMG